MTTSRLLRFGFLLTVLFSELSCRQTVQGNYLSSRAPLAQSAFIELPVGSVKADGWLLEMLCRQRDGLTGHLDELYPEVAGARNGWLGGDGDQWERGPYWIDGLLPLAYILDDDILKAKVEPWVEWILASQQENGQFGPSTDYPKEEGLQRDNCEDWWPRMVALKILQQHYSATGDERVIGLMTRYFRYQLEALPEKPLDNWTFWARFRGGDNLASVYWLYNITGDKFLLELGELLYRQTVPFTEDFLAHNKLRGVGTIHSVNLAQGMKTPVVYWQAHPQQIYLDAMDAAYEDLDAFQSYPTGMFSGDEDIHGNDPTQGTELCTIVEYMFSLETMYKITGDPRYAERLEKVAYNALPAQTDDNYMVRQYFQQVNQIALFASAKNFDVNHDGLDACFGLLTGYPCCTANMHQGWPKFTCNLWYATNKGGLAATQYAPCHVEAFVADGKKVRISEHTNYPFNENIVFTIDSIESPAAFELALRIPSWSRHTRILVNGEEIGFDIDGRSMASLLRQWKEGDRLELQLTATIDYTHWKENARSVERGPLVYALALDPEVEEVPTGVATQGETYLKVSSNQAWNYALIDKQDMVFNVKDNDSSYPWNMENAPGMIEARAVKVPVWKEYNGMAGPVPFSIMYGIETEGPVETIKMIPYGCTMLRITEFPVVGEHDAL
ncbi:MAG: glycoside hydrolase family 127 protein [Bacteroidales bacterium]|nr:glycoside hydrolase family 127 protein [Bacteroidales bacterium]